MFLQALEADVSRWQAEIPADTSAAEALGQQLEEAEGKLEALQDSIKGEVEGYHQQMSKVRPCSYGVWVDHKCWCLGL
jgi:predicted  nucleic acid-binding Zn-ribbon protein